MKKKSPHLRDDIVNTAIYLAENSSWEKVRLFDIAAALDTDLDTIYQYFSEKDEIIDAYFDRADQIMLQNAKNPECISLPAQKKLHFLLMKWLNTFVGHQAVVRQMIGSKLEPGHIHIQIPALLRISRTVQWWREAAHRQTILPKRAFEEAGLTTIYLATFTYWLFDHSAEMKETGNFLEKKLQCAAAIAHFFHFSKSSCDRKNR